MSSSVVLCIIIVNPVMDAMGIKKTETVESFSIPIQQISRTVIDNNDLSEKQEKLISELIDVEKIRELYSPYISDPVKFYISDHGNQQYFNELKTLISPENYDKLMYENAASVFDIKL